MTRKEQILNKAIEFVDKSYTNVEIKTTHEASVAACQEIAEWADKTMIEKACEFLFENYHGEKLSLRMINDFKNAMKGE